MFILASLDGKKTTWILLARNNTNDEVHFHLLLQAIFCYWITSNVFSLFYGLGEPFKFHFIFWQEINVQKLLGFCHLMNQQSPYITDFSLRIFFKITVLFIFSALKSPGVKKFLGVPEIPAAPASTAPPRSFNLLEALKQHVAARQETASPLPSEPSSKPGVQRISPASVLSQRLRSLEKQVKGRKKNINNKG